MTRQQGFTLIELIMTLVVLTIVSIGIAGFVRSSVGIFNDVTEREQLLGDSRFLLERMTRELRASVPNSLRVRGNNSVHCLQFVPIDYSTFYLDAPLFPGSDDELTVVEMGDFSGNAFVPAVNSSVIIYPTRPNHVYTTSQRRRRSVTACEDGGANTSCATLDDPNNLAVITVDNAFQTNSPADRVYFASRAHNYCVRSGNMYFHQSAITANQTVFSSGGVLMAENIVNVLSANPAQQNSNSDDPFRLFESTLLDNAYVQLRLRFERNDEVLNYNHEIHVLNVP
ncbi:type II secretion system protein [Alteromonas flava]|uniref:type II secretion system protein n=1 Tax=Alteromonas flava TaxID=2048003 RepID=UPI000C293386|nr:type II secretion system protein [Alteromonas flava]